MKLTVQLKLRPTSAQADALKHTLEAANAACDYISQVAWETQTFRQFAIHRLTYRAARETFGLAAQLTVRCIAKVADAYKLDRKVQRTFQPYGAIAYDERILSFALPDSLVSIWTEDCCEGRMHEAGDYAGRTDAYSHADEGSTVAARNTPLLGLRATQGVYHL